jgi:flagellar biosynthesis protein FlhF
MRIKKFIGTSVRDVTDQMKREFGDDAIILQSRSRKLGSGDPADVDTSDMYEITAAIDGMMPESRENLMPAPKNETFGSALHQIVEMNSAPRSAHREEFLPVHADRMPAVAELPPARWRQPVPAQTEQRPGAPGVQEIGKDLADLRSTLREVSEHLKVAKIPSLPESLRAAYNRLVSHDVDEKIAAEIVHAVGAELNEYELRGAAGTERAVLARLASLIKTGSGPRSGGKRPKVVVLVGPTGVGKTTTIAKLSAIEKLMHHHAVGLISFDTFRIGAIEQLQMFAEITEVPMEVAAAPAEVKGLLRKFGDMDVVFIDTVGRSQRKEKELRELSEMVAAAQPDETHLVVSATANVKTMLDVVDRFGLLNPTNLIFSKLDEAVAAGPLLNVACQCPLAISYLTTGQTVPYDILEADPRQVASMVWEGAFANA